MMWGFWRMLHRRTPTAAAPSVVHAEREDAARAALHQAEGRAQVTDQVVERFDFLAERVRQALNIRPERGNGHGPARG